MQSASLTTSAPAPARTQRRRLALSGPVLAAVFIAGHIPLAVVMHKVPMLATVHALACALVGLLIAVIYPPRRTALVIAYIAAVELLWRMSKASIFWEFGKYAISAIAIVALFRMRGRRFRALALCYFALLLPSALMTLNAIELDDARKELSFNLSGPLSLSLCLILFANLKLTASDIRRVMVTVIGPVLGIAALAYFSTASTEDIEFINASNSVTSGGFRATQVSPILGLGFFFSMLLLFDRKQSWRLRVPLIGLALGFAVQTALTFSRGGLGLAFASTLVVVMYLVRDRRTRITLVVLGSLFVVVGYYVVVPRLEAFTKGRFSERYTNVASSGRAQLAMYDLEIFIEHPGLGVGPGMATELHEELGHAGSSHTEFTRLLAEHGALGAVSMILLFWIATRVVRGAKTLQARALALAMVAWTMLFLALYAMRLSAPAFMLAFASAIAFSSQAAPRVKAPLRAV